MRSPVLCTCPDGSIFRATFAEADELVSDGLAEWTGRKTLRMKREGRSGGRLSLRVGAALASPALRDEGWAQVALAQINRH
jgi:hypothetical protein